MRMKRLAWAVVIAAAASLLAGCGGESSDDAYVRAVSEKAPSVLDRGTREELIELGHVICEGLGAGRSAFDIADDYTGIGWSMAEAGTVVVQAAKTICPEHEDDVT